MVLSEFTIQALKNLASVNQNIVIREGKLLETIAEARNIFVQVILKKNLRVSLGFTIWASS